GEAGTPDPVVALDLAGKEQVDRLLGEALLEDSPVDDVDRERERPQLGEPLLPLDASPDTLRRQNGMGRPEQHVPAVDGQLALEAEVGLVEKEETVPADLEAVVDVEEDERHAQLA